MEGCCRRQLKFWMEMRIKISHTTSRCIWWWRLVEMWDVGGDAGCWGDVCWRWAHSYPPVFPLQTQSHSSWCSRATSVSDLCNPLTPIFGLNWRTSWYFFVTLLGTHWHSLQLWRQQAQFPPQRLTRRQPGQKIVSVLFSSSRMDTEKLRGVQLYSLTSSLRRFRSTTLGFLPKTKALPKSCHVGL